MDILNGGDIMSFDEDCCAAETGAAYFDDDEFNQVAAVPHVGNVLISDTQYQAYREYAALVRFMDDPRAAVMLSRRLNANISFACYFTDPTTGNPGVEYGDTPSEALAAALNVVRFRKAQREGGRAA